MSSHKHSRRQFLGSIPCLALGTTTLYSSLINLKAMNSIMGSTTTVGGDYKAIVCVLLSGGNDSYNMLIPRSDAEYAEYSSVRSDLSIPQEDLLAINPQQTDGREYGLHPSMTGLRDLFEQGNVAFVNNVGTLVEPITKTTLQNGTANVPIGLLSHIDQAMHWQTALPQDRSNLGWGGKMADILKSMNEDTGVSMNISLGGNNLFQRGDTITEYAINADGGVAILGWEQQAPFLQMMREDITDMMNKEYEDVFRDSYSGVLKRSVESNEVFNSAVENIMLTTEFPQSQLGQRMEMIARSISARNELGAKRQIFFVEIGGFDNHDELINAHAGLMNTVDDAFSAFFAATQELGVSDCVTTFTISDFARTLTSNGNGTDHAWGGSAIVMGGAVNGKNMYGDYPILDLGNDLEIGGGILIPTTSADEYFAEIALWFGISPNDLSQILPNIGNFYDVGSGTGPLGFML
ncbi:MAG: DUF1501 domain-containing protein [Bacteroidota bacterium]